VSIGQLDEVDYKTDIDIDVMKIWELGGLLLAWVKSEANCLYLFLFSTLSAYIWHASRCASGALA
jgi:hypothetical protein